MKYLLGVKNVERKNSVLNSFAELKNRQKLKRPRKDSQGQAGKQHSREIYSLPVVLKKMVCLSVSKIFTN